MATTTNYGWTTPDDTALVKDGAAAIRSLGSAIDTTTKNLNPGTTNGDIDYYATGTTKSRVAIGSSGQCLTVVAGVPSWAPSATSVLTTTGDLLFASAANTLARRAIGSTGDVLTVSGGLPTWAAPASGGMTLLSTTTLSGATTTISGISGAYNHLYAYIYGVTNATADGHLRIRPNGSGTITTTWMPDLAVQPALIQNNPIYATLYSSGNPMNWLRTSANNGIAFYIHNYANTSNWKPILLTGTLTGTSNTLIVALSGGISTTSAITSLEFQNSGGNFSTGTVLLYGVK